MRALMLAALLSTASSASTPLHHADVTTDLQAMTIEAEPQAGDLGKTGSGWAPSSMQFSGKLQELGRAKRNDESAKFSGADNEGDGVMSVAKYGKMGLADFTEHIGSSPTFRKEVFHALDVDLDGQLDAEPFQVLEIQSEKRLTRRNSYIEAIASGRPTLKQKPAASPSVDQGTDDLAKIITMQELEPKQEEKRTQFMTSLKTEGRRQELCKNIATQIVNQSDSLNLPKWTHDELYETILPLIKAYLNVRGKMDYIWHKAGDTPAQLVASLGSTFPGFIKVVDKVRTKMNQYWKRTCKVLKDGTSYCKRLLSRSNSLERDDEEDRKKMTTNQLILFVLALIGIVATCVGLGMPPACALAAAIAGA